MWWTKSLGRSAALAALLAASACAGGPKGPPPLTPTQSYAPRVETAPERLGLSVHPQGLSGAQRQALSDFAARWREQGGGPIVLQTPDGPEGDAALATASFARASLEEFGVPSAAIRQDRYAPDGAGPAPVLASFDRLQVVTPDCSKHWDNLTSTLDNRAYGNFGCAVTANLATQVADPRDLTAPPPMASGDNLRREVVLGKYRGGKITSSEKDDQATGTVSSVARQ